MPSMIKNLKDQYTLRAKYGRTLTELRRMDPAVMSDLDLRPSDLPAIAHKAVYGF